MSRQTTFYATPADTERIHKWLLSEFPGVRLVSQRRGPREHTILRVTRCFGRVASLSDHCVAKSNGSPLALACGKHPPRGASCRREM